MSLGAVLQIATALVLVVGLIFAAAWVMKRFGRLQGTATDQLRLVGGIQLGQRERIVVVQAGDQRLVVGVTPGCIRTLHVLPAGEHEEGDAAPGGFLGKFNEEIRKRMHQ